jgi:serine/threonine-protein kinase RsbW
MTLDGDMVELTVPAQIPYLAVVRTATAGLAARLGFTLDEIEDLRIAVDEACSMLLSLPTAPERVDSSLTCRFNVIDDGLAVSVTTAVTAKAALPPHQSFAWQVLTAHASELAGTVADGRATIDLVKRRLRH